MICHFDTMTTQPNNTNVYEFLIEVCREKPQLWSVYGESLEARSADNDYLERLSEELDCFRICEECGRPMVEGFVVDGCSTYCCEECLHKHISEEEFNRLFDYGNGETYWTTWWENSAFNPTEVVANRTNVAAQYNETFLNDKELDALW
ncbi:MAG: hypothetical protein J6A02_08540 [Prevotella sp.]|nr:hypothetical protein [Prevotella sp.]